MSASASTREGAFAAWVIGLGALTTVLAQFIPQLDTVFILIWVGFVLIAGVKFRSEIILSGFPPFCFAVGILLGIYCCFCYLATGERGYLGGFLLLYIKTLLMYVVGLMAFPAMGTSARRWKVIFAFYLVGAGAYFIWAMANYFPGLSAWMSNKVYLFSSKNSMGQICAVASVFLLVVVFSNKRTALRVLFATLAAAFWVGILIMQCRTAALGVVFACVSVLVAKRMKRVLLVMAAVLLLVVAASPEIQSFLIHAFFLDKYSGAGVDEMSSGRLGLWNEALAALRGHEMIGLGEYYTDNLYINVLVNLGLVGFLLLMAMWVPRVALNVKLSFSGRVGSGTLFGLLLPCTVFYFFESLLEGRPPFGPGTCSFLFRIICGYCDAAKVKAARQSLSS